MTRREIDMLGCSHNRDKVLRHVMRREPRPHGWHELYYFNAPGTRDTLTALRIYASLGLHPIVLHGIRADGDCTCGRPSCGAAGKHPVAAGWQRGELDLDVADRMLASNWRLNLGLRMGPQPGGFHLVCVDVDGPRELLAPLEAENGVLPETLAARTGSGGLHLVFRVGDSTPIKNAVRLAPGIDIRSRGGQIVVSPSRHRSGNFYTWIDVRDPAELRKGT